jgi:UDPglucose 6-dehydrogenase
MRISVIGAGYVGLTTAACLAEIGHEVLCAEINAEKLATLERGGVPFFEPHLAPLIEKNRQKGRLQFCKTPRAIEHSHAIFICVGTPPLENGEADLSAIEALARAIASQAKGYRLVIEKSTVPVQTGRQLERHLSLYSRNGLDYDVASNPEFLREGTAIEDFFHPDRIVAGVAGERAAKQIEEIYHPILQEEFKCPVHEPCQDRKRSRLLLTDVNSAEIIKHASNSFLAMKISFINAIADLCEAAGADIERVAEGIGMDHRIGAQFLKPGIGFGGFCFPKDLQAFVRIAEKFGVDFSLLREAEKVNLSRPSRFVDNLKKELWVLRGKKIAVWGLAFKPNTDDVRFAPALEIIRRLLSEGAEVSAYDPQAMEKARAVLSGVRYGDDPYDAVRKAEALLVLTEWEEFKHADLQRVRSLMERPLLVDGRNMFKREEAAKHGFEYLGIGQSGHVPTPTSVRP